MSHSTPDRIHRFLLDNSDLRGEVVSLNQSLLNATAHQQLPAPIQRLLGEFLAAASLLTEILKLSGTLTLQARGAGPIPLIMAESDDRRHVRGIVKLREGLEASELLDTSLPHLLGEGVLSLTIEPEHGKRYQGIVALQGETLADSLNNYFQQSEQLPTRLWLAADAQGATGLLLQALPPPTGEAPKTDAWETALTLADTVRAEELLTLDHTQLLQRLFHEFDVRLFPAHPVAFKCRCSRERSANALTAMGRDDAYALLAERDVIETHCDFCGTGYRFGLADLDALFQPPAQSLH